MPLTVRSTSMELKRCTSCLAAKAHSRLGQAPESRPYPAAPEDDRIGEFRADLQIVPFTDYTDRLVKRREPGA